MSLLTVAFHPVVMRAVFLSLEEMQQARDLLVAVSAYQAGTEPAAIFVPVAMAVLFLSRVDILSGKLQPRILVGRFGSQEEALLWQLVVQWLLYQVPVPLVLVEDCLCSLPMQRRSGLLVGFSSRPGNRLIAAVVLAATLR
jgi:hypothetical protein